jgi:hypothetical protein
MPIPNREDSRRRKLEETKTIFYEYLNGKLAHVNYQKPEQEANISSRIGETIGNQKLDGKIEQILSFMITKSPSL